VLNSLPAPSGWEPPSYSRPLPAPTKELTAPAVSGIPPLAPSNGAPPASYVAPLANAAPLGPAGMHAGMYNALPPTGIGTALAPALGAGAPGAASALGAAVVGAPPGHLGLGPASPALAPTLGVAAHPAHALPVSPAGPAGVGAGAMNPLHPMHPMNPVAPGMEHRELGSVPNPAAMVPNIAAQPNLPVGYPAAYPQAGGLPGAPYPQRPGAAGYDAGHSRRFERTERWRTAALILGAVTMAVLAFAVTRSCMHPAAPAPRAPPASVPSAPSH
jgi:hypothetical protein